MGWETTICCDDQEGPWDGECQNEGSQTGRPTPRAVGVGLAGHFVSLGGERRFQLGVRARRKIGVGGERISRAICWHSLPVFHDQLALRHNADVHHRAVSCCRCCRRTAVLGHAAFPPGGGCGTKKEIGGNRCDLRGNGSQGRCDHSRGWRGRPVAGPFPREMRSKGESQGAGGEGDACASGGQGIGALGCLAGVPRADGPWPFLGGKGVSVHLLLLLLLLLLFIIIILSYPFISLSPSLSVPLSLPLHLPCLPLTRRPFMLPFRDALS